MLSNLFSKSKASSATSVAVILADFKEKINQLLNLVEEKYVEIDEANVEIQNLEVKIDAAAQEANAAKVAADKLQTFFN